MSALDIRTVGGSEYENWLRAVNTGFLSPPTPGTDQVERNRRTDAEGASRLLGAFDGDRCVATLRSFPQELTAVGGAFVPADAVSAVTVSPTHRRQGLLTRMLGRDLAEAKERGDVVATLIAAEYPIYGRYGFGPATWASQWTVEVSRAGLDPRRTGCAGGGRISLVDGAEVRKLGPELHERFRAGRPGAVSRVPAWWDTATGLLRSGPNWTEPYLAVHRSASGETQGLVSYRAEHLWQGNQPEHTIAVDWLLATTPAAERALWHYLCSIDWVTKVTSDGRAPDDLLPQFLPDPRAARITEHSDWLWLRILDVVRALEARTYETSGTTVLEVVDRQGGYGGGRFRLEASAQGASCTPTTGSADLTLGIGELGTVWLGGESLTRLVALGRVQEEREGAARKADALFRSPGHPWCPDLF
ncbi:GNAT family N-acetyltransferase [Streptomyces broussonetiae]|uniref:GNAT family N-acetyltransferase n=1 Tax=Streptomyces broussonetiae TaxID=2686304 RepID=A0A6I6N1V4_9ACTN|nr:GNAT family N-acetyltransferase [Streptomyces broussonetiae]QHA05512.1 GNAT family N-acetyltransferase [Streptomyces broussonetiae]